jgi:ribosomal-protein-alanine N-acetyltransferase
MSLPIETERLILRRYTRDDVEDILEFGSHPSVARATREIDATEAGVERYIDLQNSYQPFEKDRCFDLAIERQDNGKVIGLVTLIVRDHKQGEIGYALGVEHRGHGYATEAAQGLMAHGFLSLDLHRIYACTSSRNPDSWAVMERLGMRREGHSREAILEDGEWLDHLVYAILAREWEHREGFPRLQTRRLFLRQLTLGDIEFVFRHFSDSMVTRYLFDEEPLARREQAQELIRFYMNPTGKTYNRWAIVLRSENALVGTCGYHKWDKRHRRAEIGYDLGPRSWGQGIMSEALAEVFRYGFEQMGLNRIDALVYPQNTRSVRLLAKLGFRKEGLLREYFRLGDEYYDHLLFSLLGNDWAGEAV